MTQHKTHWQLNAERISGFEIDYELELGGHLNRKLHRLFPSQDAIDVGGRAPEQIRFVRSIGEQAAGPRKSANCVDCGQPVLRCQRRNRCAVHECIAIRRYDEAAERLAPKGDDGRFDLCVAMNVRNDCHDLE